MEYTARTFALPAEIPGLSQKQLQLHLGLYEGYVKHVNHQMTQMRALATSETDFSYAIAELRRRLGFEWNGMRLHELYFEALEGGSTALHANTKLYKAFIKQYGGLTEWLEVFKKVSARGPGWALLTYDAEAEHFFHVWVADHEMGNLASLPVILALDHWEHAYLVDYVPADKAKYVDAYLTALNWDIVAQRFDKIA
jgi:Fe-Mn family superoxide dismutase